MLPTLPVKITKEELDSFNEFWQSLSPNDLAIFNELTSLANQHRAAEDHSGYY